jgi:hypothetical protein
MYTQLKNSTKLPVTDLNDAPHQGAVSNLCQYKKGQIVNIENSLYRVGDSKPSSLIRVCWHDGPIFAYAKTYYPVENQFPYNDLPEISPIVFDGGNITGSIIYIFPEEPMEMVSLIKNECKISKEFFNRIRNEWVKIGDKEYKITYAFGGERFNLIYREPGQIKDVYPILFTDDWDSFS